MSMGTFMKDNINLTVYFDYTCPWVRQAGLWLRMVDTALKERFRLNWRCYLLEQINSSTPGWKALEQDSGYTSRGIWPHRGGLAARIQGKEEHWKYAEAIFELKHVRREDVRSRESILGIGKIAGLDMDRFTNDLDSPTRLEEINTQHTEAENMGIFGTPTFVLEDGSAAFLKTFTPPEEEALEMFEAMLSLISRPRFGELKRPQPPWPKGVSV